MTEPEAIVVHAKAPAKINLALAVGPKRDDGFHPLVSVMHAIDMCDDLTVRLEPAVEGDPMSSHVATRLHVIAPTLPGGDTLVTRAMQAVCEHLDVRLHVDVELDKRIPPGAGLGGGSSDAACAMKTLNEMLGSPIDEATMVELGGRIGSDVPFFLTETGTAVATGRGELVVPVEPIEPREWLIAWPGVEQSTARVYEKFQPSRDELPGTAEALAAARAGAYFNDLTHIACTICRDINRLDSLLRWTGLTPYVAGSGSAMFAPLIPGIDAAAVLDAVRGLPDAHVWLASSLVHPA